MALPYRHSGTIFTRSKGIIDAIEKQVKFVNLKPVKRLTFSYNPFDEHVMSIRSVSQFLFRDQVRDTNLKCSFKTAIHNKTEEPVITVNLESGKTIIFKTSHLTSLEILKKFNELITPVDQAEEE